MKKVTIKEQILQFVESKGSARYTEIQRFIVDRKFGEGTYDNGNQVRDTWVWNKKLQRGEMRPRKLNSNRGYYSTNLAPHGYLRKGPDRLIKHEDGTFHVLRSSSIGGIKAPLIAAASKPSVSAPGTLFTTSHNSFNTSSMYNDENPFPAPSSLKSSTEEITVNLSIALDPSYEWTIKTINGKNYLTIK